MQQQDNAYIGIGVFIVGAVLLSIMTVLFFYTEYLHGKRETFVMLFSGSLTGLDSSSPVTYRGVTIGKVKRIELTTNNANTNISIPVYVEFFIEKSFVNQKNPIQLLIAKGIVAEISAPNLLTGTAGIELVPGTKQAPLKVSVFHGYLRFPTDNSTQEDHKTTDTLKTLRTTLQDVSRFINSKDVNEAMDSIKNMAQSVNTLAVKLDKQIPQEFKGITQSMKDMANTANLFTAQFNQVPNLIVNFRDSLQDISKTSYSFRSLSDYLLRHPESLLRGK